LSLLKAENLIKINFEKRGFELNKTISKNTFNLVFQDKEMGYNIFFKFYDSIENLKENWNEKQNKVKQIIDEKKLKAYNSYLIFGVSEKIEFSDKTIQRILYDEYICKKLLFTIGEKEEELKKSLQKFPFYPLDISEITSVELPKGVPEALSQLSYDTKLIRDIDGRTGVETIIDNIYSNKYEMEVSRETPESQNRDSLFYPPTSKSLKRIEIENFRGIGEKLSLNLDGDIIVFYGPNGTGKTSIIDAFEWVITGEVERLRRKIEDVNIKYNDIIVNVFHKNKPAIVNLEIGGNEETLNIEMALLSGKSEIVKINGEKKSNKAVIKEITGNEQLSLRVANVKRLRTGFRASHILIQNILTKFVRDTSPEERYETLSYLTATQDFISFQVKTEKIMKELDTRIIEVKRENSNIYREIDSLKEEIKKEEKTLKQASKELISEHKDDLLKEIKKANEKLDKFLPKNLIEALAEPTEEISETLVNISSKYLKDIQEEIEKVKENIEKAKEISKMKAQNENILAQKEQVAKQIEKERDALEELKLQIMGIKQTQGEILNLKKTTSKSLENINWLIKIQPVYREKDTKTDKLYKELKELSKLAENISKKRKELEEELNKKDLEAKKKGSEISFVEKKIRVINSILDSLNEWEGTIISIENIEKEMKQVEEKQKILVNELNEKRKKLNYLNEEAVKLQKQIKLKEDEYSQELKLIGQLKNYIHSEECPFCGHKWKSMDNLISNVEKKLQELPQSMQIQLDKKKHLEGDKKSFEIQIKNIETQIEKLKQKAINLPLKKRELESKIMEWQRLLDSISSKYNTKKVKKFNLPTKESLETFKKDLQSNVNLLSRQKVNLEKENKDKQINVDDLKKKEKNIEVEISEKKKELNLLNKEINEIKKEISNKNLIDYFNKSLNELLLEKQEISETLKTKAEEETNLESKLKRFGTKLKKDQEKLDALSKKFKKIENISEKISKSEKELRMSIRLYLPGIDDLTQEKILEKLNSLEKQKSEDYKLYASLKGKAENLKSIIVSDALKKKIGDLKKKCEDYQKNYEKKEKELKNKEQWKNTIKNLKETVGKKRKEQEKSYLDLFNPTTKLVYDRLNPHPLLGEIDLRIEHKKLKIVSNMETELRESKEDSEVPPSHIFSEAQLNTLAISIFLASALEQGWSKFKGIFFDDPVQNMDDLNSFAFLDLILGLTKNEKQFVITTCNLEFYKLMLLKFSSLNQNKKKRFIAYRLGDITENGPTLIQDAGNSNNETD